MPGKAAKVRITERQQVVLREFSRSRTESAALAQRARIILAAFEGRLNEDIAAEVGLNRKQVGAWRRRWQAAWEALTRLECLEPARLRGAIRETLADAPRSGSPGIFTAAQVCQILAVACEPPEQSGRPITHWTRTELRDEVVQRGIVENISASQVGRYLREAQLQPHRRTMWINTKEKDPELFQQQVEAVCQTYLQANERFEQDGTRTVCCDEMTGIQALERAAPDQPLESGRPLRQEFEYIRHGTTTVIGNWDVVQGTTFSPTIGPTRTEEDFVAHIDQTVATDPDAPWMFVLDRLNIHCSAGLTEWVAQRCEPDRPLGKKGVRGVLRSQATRREFLSQASHRIRFVFLPKHSSWLNQVEMVFGVVMRKLIRRGSFTSVEHLQGRLQAFFDYYNSTLAHPFDWTYTGRPLAKPRRSEFRPPHRRRPHPTKVQLANRALA